MPLQFFLQISLVAKTSFFLFLQMKLNLCLHCEAYWSNAHRDQFDDSECWVPSVYLCDFLYFITPGLWWSLKTYGGKADSGTLVRKILLSVYFALNVSYCWRARRFM